MQSAATYCGTVYPWQCDHVGHMNIMWYVGKFDEANWPKPARSPRSASSPAFTWTGRAASPYTIRRTAAKLLAFPEPADA